MTWTPDDLANYGDQALDELRLAVLAEQERRQRLAIAPSMVADMTRRFVKDGGNPDDLTAAVAAAATPPAAIDHPAEDPPAEPAEPDPGPTD